MFYLHAAFIKRHVSEYIIIPAWYKLCLHVHVYSPSAKRDRLDNPATTSTASPQILFDTAAIMALTIPSYITSYSYTE